MILREIPEYNQLNLYAFDIETTGLDWEKDRILLIGVMNVNNPDEYYIFEGSELKILKQFANFLKKFKKDWLILTGHNIFNFDLPFVQERAKKYGIWKYWQVDLSYKFPLSATNQYGNPLEVYPVKSIDFIDFVDLYPLLNRWDNVARKLTGGYGLKSAVKELKLIERDDRLLLTEEEFRKAKDLEKMKEYLKQDLEDTVALTNFLLPAQYYRLAYTPENISLTRMLLMGNATLWERRIESFYSYDYVQKQKPDEKYKYKGAITGAREGIFFKPKKIYKIDIASLYPSIMLYWKLFSRKDKNAVALKLLESMTKERLEKWKPLGKKGDKLAKAREGALKIEINSLYGFYGTANMKFNDMKVAEEITAKGRCILTKMIKAIEKLGGEVLEVDTDGIIFSFDKDLDLLKEEIYKEVPAFFKYDIEFKADMIIVKGKKNYAVIKDRKAIIKKGVFTKRDVSKFERDFYVNYAVKLAYDGLEEAEKYKQDMINMILKEQKTEDDINYFAIERTIKKTDKKLLEQGAKARDRIKTWFDVEKIGKKGKVYYTPSLKPPQNWRWYIEKVEEIADEVKKLYFNPGKECEYGLPLENCKLK